jgi:hypothetical protein
MQESGCGPKRRKPSSASMSADRLKADLLWSLGAFPFVRPIADLWLEHPDIYPDGLSLAAHRPFGRLQLTDCDSFGSLRERVRG